MLSLFEFSPSKSDHSRDFLIEIWKQKIRILLKSDIIEINIDYQVSK